MPEPSVRKYCSKDFKWNVAAVFRGGIGQMRRRRAILAFGAFCLIKRAGAALPLELRDVLMSEDFGMRGGHDVTDQLREAMAAASGKTLVFTPGIYRISSSISVAGGTHIHLQSGAVIENTAPNTSFFSVSGVSSVRISGYGKFLQSTAGARAYVAAIMFSDCVDCKVDGALEFEGLQWAGVYILNSHRCEVSGAYMHHWQGAVDNSAGVIIYKNSNDNLVDGCRFEATGWLGAYVQDPGGAGEYNPQRNKIRNSKIRKTTAYGAMLYVGAAGNSFNEITGCTIEGVTGAAGLGQYGMGIYAMGHGLGGCKIIGNTVSDCCIAQTVTTNGYAGIVVTGNTPGYAKPVVANNTVRDMSQGCGIQVISCPGGAVVEPNRVHIPGSNEGMGPGGLGLLGKALMVWNSDDVRVEGGDYVNEGAGEGIQLLATDGDHGGISITIGHVRTARGVGVVASRTGSYTVAGKINGGNVTASSDSTNAMQLTGFSGSIANVILRAGSTARALAALAAAKCPYLAFTGMDVESTGTTSVSLGEDCTGTWDRSNRHVGRFENRSRGFRVE